MITQIKCHPNPQSRHPICISLQNTDMSVIIIISTEQRYNKSISIKISYSYGKGKRRKEKGGKNNLPDQNHKEVDKASRPIRTNKGMNSFPVMRIQPWLTNHKTTKNSSAYATFILTVSMIITLGEKTLVDNSKSKDTKHTSKQQN